MTGTCLGKGRMRGRVEVSGPGLLDEFLSVLKSRLTGVGPSPSRLSTTLKPSAVTGATICAHLFCLSASV